MPLEQIANLPISQLALDNAHLHLWVPNRSSARSDSGHRVVGICLQDLLCVDQAATWDGELLEEFTRTTPARHSRQTSVSYQHTTKLDGCAPERSTRQSRTVSER